MALMCHDDVTFEARSKYIFSVAVFWRREEINTSNMFKCFICVIKFKTLRWYKITSQGTLNLSRLKKSNKTSYGKITELENAYAYPTLIQKSKA